MAYFTNMQPNDLINSEIKRGWERKIQLRNQRQPKLWPLKENSCGNIFVNASWSEKRENGSQNYRLCHVRAPLGAQLHYTMCLENWASITKSKLTVQFRGPCRKIIQSLRKSSQTWQGYEQGLGSPCPDSSWLAFKVPSKLHSKTHKSFVLVSRLCPVLGQAAQWGNMHVSAEWIRLAHTPDPWSSEQQRQLLWWCTSQCIHSLTAGDRWMAAV